MFDKKKAAKDIGLKWLTVPMGIFLVLFAGSALNLTDRIGVMSQLAGPVIQYMVRKENLIVEDLDSCYVWLLFRNHRWYLRRQGP